MLPSPRFIIGDVVYRVDENVTIERYPCPDCRDTKTWTATTAAGEVVKVPCCRCGTQWSRPDQVPPLNKTVAVSSVRRLTIGSVQINTEDDHPVRYMCRETGIGSGWVHSESDLYATEQDANRAAARANAARQTVLDTHPEALKAETYAKLPLQVAIARGWREEIYHAWDRARDLTEAVERVVKNEGGEYEVGDDTVEFLSDSLSDRPSWRQPHPVDVLLEAAKSAARWILPPPVDEQLRSALALFDYRERGAK